MAYTTIDNPGLFFNTVLYSGDNSTGRSITGVGFAPDFLWLKDRTTAGSAHFLSDTVRGDGKWLRTNGDFAENTDTNVITSLDSDGFTVGNDVYSNKTGDNYVAWNWLGANGTASNSNGGITSTVSANTTAGFSIVQYVGTSSDNTVGHGLGAIPKMIITKSTSASGHWSCYHNKLPNGADSYIELNKTSAASNLSLSPDYWGTPSSTVFGVKGGYGNSVNGRTYIAYCFAEIKGYSKFGSFTGNGNADGTFVYTGFKPAFIIEKLSSGTGSWLIYDNKRNGINGDNHYFYANGSDAELTTQLIDITSNGFKHRHAGGANSSGTSIYMAFAESPLVANVGTGVPATAR